MGAGCAQRGCLSRPSRKAPHRAGNLPCGAAWATSGSAPPSRCPHPPLAPSLNVPPKPRGGRDHTGGSGPALWLPKTSRKNTELLSASGHGAGFDALRKVNFEAACLGS